MVVELVKWITHHTHTLPAIIIIIIIITKTEPLQKGSPGLFDECRMAPSGRRPKTKPDDLGCESIVHVTWDANIGYIFFTFLSSYDFSALEHPAEEKLCTVLYP